MHLAENSVLFCAYLQRLSRLTAGSIFNAELQFLEI
jgi:hypothetical protein